MSDDSLFEELVSRFYRRVYYFFVKHRFSKEDSRDLTQVVFARLYVGMKAYRGGEWAYVRTIANRVRLNEIRYRRTISRDSPTASLEDLAQPLDQIDVRPVVGDSSPSPEQELLNREREQRREELSRILKEAISELPPRMRRCMLMRIEGGLKYREIADALGVSMDSVKRMIYEAKKKLKDRLADWDDMDRER